MLLIRGIYLLLSHSPTSHTTVRAVPHTAVSCFLILRCVASCSSAIPMSSITSILLSDSVLSSSIESSFRTSDEVSHKVTFIYYCTARFGPSLQAHVPWVLWRLLTSHGKLYCRLSYIELFEASPMVRRPPRIRALFFPSYTHFIYTNHSE